MDIMLAKTFLAVIETGSFVHAAEKVCATQSTVSARIKNLEDLLGVQLFERSKSGTKLTPPGEQFQKHALALIRIWQHAQFEVGLAEEKSAHLSVGAQISLWENFLLKWIAWIRNELPNLTVTATMGFTTMLIDRLIEGTLDLAVIYRAVHRPGLIVEHLFDEELVLVTSGSGTEKKPGEDYIFVNWGPEFKKDHAEAFPDLRHIGLHLDLGSIGISYLLENKASGYFPIRIVKPYLENDDLRLVPRARKFIYPVYAVYPEDTDAEAYEPFLMGLRKTVEKF